MAQRLGEWLASAPQIEEDMALGNIGLDLLGQARSLLTRAGELSAEAGGPAYTEDDLAYWRDERSFTNVQLVEQERGDFAVTMVRLLVLSTWQLHLYRAPPAVDRPGDRGCRRQGGQRGRPTTRTTRGSGPCGSALGTDVSRAKMEAALAAVAPYVPELFDDDELTETLAAQGIAVLPVVARGAGRGARSAPCWPRPGCVWPEPTWRARGGRDGRHSTAMGHLLAEMQHLARSHPGATW